MFQPPRKQIKIESVEQPNTIRETDASSSSCLNVTPAQSHGIKIPRETVVNVNFDNKPLPKRARQWCNIVYREEPNDVYKLGQIILKLTSDEPNAKEKLESDFTNANVAQRFPGLHSIRIQVEGISSDSKNIVEFRTRREILREEAVPNLTSKCNKRPLSKDHKFIELKCFAFSFEKLNVPLFPLFGRPGKEITTRKIFKLEFEKFNAFYKEIVLQVKLYSSVIQGDKNYVEATAPDMTDAIPLLDYYFLNRKPDSRINDSLAQHRSSDDAQRFFSLMREYHTLENRPQDFEEDSVQDPRMMPQLLDYQKEAVVWMLSREGVLELSEDDNHTTESLQKSLLMHINTRVSLKTVGNKSLGGYYSRTSGRISWQKQLIDKLPSRGGILADEMGLGKTIEMLSLILLNPRPDVTNAENEFNGSVNVNVIRFSFECTCGIWNPHNENTLTCCDCGNTQHSTCLGFSETCGVPVPNNYLCPHCLEKLPPKPSKSTLIVVPNSILKQWEEEIQNNIRDESLNIYIYNGLSGTKKYVHPLVMSQYDIVLTTYEVLRQEMHFTDLGEEKRLRDRKRYAALPCPLILVEWWRVCLDEAQMVENVNWSFAKMACRLPAVNRWCVTGTPIPNGLQDLYGVVCFLGIEPINDSEWWECLIMEPFKLNNGQIDITKNLFGKIFWRTEKEYVQEQMRLPRQTEVIHRLEFTPVEKYFYNQRLVHWFDKFKAEIVNVERDQQISTLSNSQLLPFQRLRQICTHPQLDDEAFQAVDIFIEREAKLTLTVFELVEWLVKRATARCQKQYKLQVFALNALAALHFVKDELEVAARQYRRVIQLADENKDRWKTDDVNLLQALINLSEVYKKLRLGDIDRTLDTQADELQKKTAALNVISRAIAYKELDGNFGTDDDAWWIRVFSHIRNSTNAVQLFEELVRSIKKTVQFECMALKQPNVQRACDAFACMTSLQSMLQESLLKIATQRKEIFSEWQKINSMVANVPTYSNISLSDCGHFSDGALPCGLCSFERELSIYGSLLSRAPQPSDYVIEDVWVKSWTQSVVDVVCQFAKKNQLPLAIQEQGKRHIGQFCDLLNEIQEFWKWLTSIHERMNETHALLEETKPITMNPNATATSNPQKQRMPGVTRLQRLTALEPVQIDPRIQLEISKLDLSNQTFKDCLRDLEYLKGLQKYSSYNSNASIVELKPEMCPVDHGTQKWGFLPCSHFFCANCYSETDNFDFECSICSTKFAKQAIRFIDMQRCSKHTVTNIPSWEISDETIWRTPFTKVEGVIRTLLSLRRSHPNEKALVICTSVAMLKVFAAEFHQNAISYILYKSGSGRKANRTALIRYRTDATQVLLMPLTVASTGLNLTEASHVLLVEPITNLAIEEQAIGRIHRLGQKKPTFVHRFYVADTIEEKLIRMDEGKKLSTFVEGNMTVQELLDLFVDNGQRFSQQ